MGRVTIAVVCALALCATLVVADSACYYNTSLAFIVDTSVSTDEVAVTMRAALDAVANKNGAVLSFIDYQLSTWGYMANDVKHFPTIQELETFFVTDPKASTNTRQYHPPPPSHDDWAYMLMSLDIAVDNAKPNGFIVVLGDEDELCDGRPGKAEDPFGVWCGNYDNTAYDALIPGIKQKAKDKNLRISFYYFVKPVIHPDGSTSDKYTCPSYALSITHCSRIISMETVREIATVTGGVALFNTTIADDMALEVKLQGKHVSVCQGCAEDSTLAMIVDTSGDPVRVKKQMLDLFASVSSSRFLKPFNHYLLSSWATPTVTVRQYNTFSAMYAAIQNPTFYTNVLALNNSLPVDVDRSNDWLAMVNNLREMVTQVGVGGYIMVITDTDAFCDAGRYSQNVWTGNLQRVIAMAETKQVAVSWYMFDDGNHGDEPGDTPTCLTVPLVTQGYHNALGRADAMAIILAGQSMMNIDASSYAASLDQMAGFILAQSQRASCRNCTVNATLGFLVDTSVSSGVIKTDYRWLFAQIATMASELAGFTGGFMLNTYEYAFDAVFPFQSVDAMNAFVVASPLAPNRVAFDVPLHNHDDWRYMLESLPVMVNRVGKNGDVVVVADDNQVCDALQFRHNSSEPGFAQALMLARQMNVKISYFQVPTSDHVWCSPAEMARGQGLAWMLANATGGTVFFGSDSSRIRDDLTDHLFPLLVAEGARTPCPEICPAGTAWVVDHCMQVNPCDLGPCENGGICRASPFSTTFSCNCTQSFYGPRCQFPCVPHSYFNQTNHALAMVLDTSDSTAFAINSMKAALGAIATATASFDEFFLSTWAYLPPHAPLVKAFPTAADVLTELSDANAGKNERTKNDSGLSTHNDWKYMLDSVEATLPLMGQNGVLLVVTDFEGVCDADPYARLVNGVTRYPMNPDDGRVRRLNQMALDNKIKIFFFTFPSADSFGYCNATQKADYGLKEAYVMTGGTGGIVEDVKGWWSAQNMAAVTNALIYTTAGQAGAMRCACQPPYGLNAYNTCVPQH